MAEAASAPEGGTAGAILLAVLGEDAAAALVDALAPGEVAAVCGAMGRLERVDEGAIDTVLAEFLRRASDGNPVAATGGQVVERAVARSLGPRARAVLGAPAAAHPVWARIGWLGDAALARLAAEEHPQVVALVLAGVAPARAEAALAALPEGQAADILHRLATLGPVDTATLDDLARLVEECMEAEGDAPVAAGGGAGAVAAIINRQRRPAADRTLRALARLDRGLAAAIDAERVRVDDLLALPDRMLGAVLRSAPADDLLRVLKGLDETARERLLGCLSTRAGQTIRDALAELDVCPVEEIEAATRALLGVARRLADEGTIRFGDGG